MLLTYLGKKNKKREELNKIMVEKMIAFQRKFPGIPYEDIKAWIDDFNDKK